MIFQDPRAHTNPVHTIGDFLTEAQCEVGGASQAEARRRAVELLADVGIPDGEERLAAYPHQLSGGLLQRVMIASALASDPTLLLADEPTTALDVTTQAEVMAILGRLRRERDLAMLFITHNLELAAATCDRTAVMYAGCLVEVQRSRSAPPDSTPSLYVRPALRTAEHRPHRPPALRDPRPPGRRVRRRPRLRVRAAMQLRPGAMSEREPHASPDRRGIRRLPPRGGACTALCRAELVGAAS